MDRVDVIVSGYEWICTNCNELNKEIEYKEKVVCSDCGTEFEAELPEHCYG